MDLEKNIEIVDINQLSPYVRYIKKCYHLGHLFYVPWRIIYDYELMFIIDGSMNIVKENEEYSLAPGDLHLMCPFELHTQSVPTDSFCHYYTIHFDLSYLGQDKDFSALTEYAEPCDAHLPKSPINEDLLKRPFAQFKELNLPEKIHLIDPNKYITLFDEMVKAYEEKPHCYNIMLKSCMLNVLNYLVSQIYLQNNQKSVHHADIISKITQYIYDNYNDSESLDLEKLAKSNGLSSSYFRRLFKQVHNISPTELIIELRIKKAIIMISEGKNTISEVCAAIGYDDLQYFSKLFKKRTGYSPLKYKTLYSNTQQPT